MSVLDMGSSRSPRRLRDRLIYALRSGTDNARFCRGEEVWDHQRITALRSAGVRVRSWARAGGAASATGRRRAASVGFGQALAHDAAASGAAWTR